MLNMFYKHSLLVLIVVLPVVILVEYAENDGKIDIDVSSYSPTNKTTGFFKHYVSVSQNVFSISVSNLPSTAGFFVIQLHAHEEEIHLTNSTGPTTNSVKGTDVGLVQVNYGADSYEFFVKCDAYVTALLSVIIYSDEAPIPGGCNMVFNTEIAPYQYVRTFDDIIRVDVQPASIPSLLCEITKIDLEYYHLYLPERYYDEVVYLMGIEKMLTVDDIRKHGKRIPNDAQSIRTYYSAYKGVGSIFAVIAVNGNESSAYVPAISYGCNTTSWEENCDGPATTQRKIIVAALVVFGFFLSHLGHTFFKTSLFAAAFIVGFLITSVALALLSDQTLEEGLITSLIFGCIYGTFWICLWWKFGMPFFSVHLSFVLAGLLLVSIVFYSGTQDCDIFRSDLLYWTVAVSCALSFTIGLAVLADLSHILVWALIGSYSILAAISYYIGSNLHYIVINTYRRATVYNFHFAMVDPPYQEKDVVLTVAWMFLVVSGVYFQMRFQRGRPPFPPHRLCIFRRSDDGSVVRESTPLLSTSRRPRI